MFKCSCKVPKISEDPISTKCIARCIILTGHDTSALDTHSCKSAPSRVYPKSARAPAVRGARVTSQRFLAQHWQRSHTDSAQKHTHLHVAFPEGGAGSFCRAAAVDGELRLRSVQCTKVTRRSRPSQKKRRKACLTEIRNRGRSTPAS